MKDLISIIMPCYNSERSIENTIKSVQSQSFKDYELVIVNDGSTDKSVEIVQRMMKDDTRIKLLQKKNGGVSSARNLALEHIKGNYVMFVDSDDNYTTTTAIETMYNTIKKNKVDMVICHFEHPVFDMYAESRKYDLTNSEDLFKLYDDFFSIGMPWNKIYKREVITEKFDTNLTFTEDELFNVANLKNMKSVMIIPDVLYNYYTAPKDSTPKSAINSIFDNADFATSEKSFYYFRKHLSKFHDKVLRRNYPDTAMKMRVERLFDFMLWDIAYMIYLDVDPKDQCTLLGRIILEDDIQLALRLKQDNRLTLRYNDLKSVQNKIKDFVMYANKKENSLDIWTNKMSIWKTVFQRDFYERNIDNAELDYFENYDEEYYTTTKPIIV